MKLASLLGIAFLALTTAAPSNNDSNVISPNLFQNGTVIHTSQHEIISMTLSPTSLNLRDYLHPLNDGNSEPNLLFIEADVKDNGEMDYKGLYLLKGNVTTKILDTATDIAADFNWNAKNVYISASDGLYVYNSETGKVERYGAITDNLIDVKKKNSNGELYVLTADNVVYKVTDNADKKVKVDDVKGAKQIVLDSDDNLFYYGADKQPYVLTKEGVKKIEGLPANPESVALVKPTSIYDEPIRFFSDAAGYHLFADGSSRPNKVLIQAKLSATALGGSYIYFAYNKKIYKIRIP